MIRMHNSNNIAGKGQLMNTGFEDLKEKMDKQEISNKQIITILYKNWKGNLGIRHIIPCGPLRWGTTEYHKEEQWLMEVYDLDKGDIRTYAFKDIKYVED